MTRAKYTLFLSYSVTRFYGFQNSSSQKSQFISDLINSSSNDLEIIPLEQKFQDLRKDQTKFLESSFDDFESSDEEEYEEDDQSTNKENDEIEFNHFKVANQVNFLYPNDVNFLFIIQI